MGSPIHKLEYRSGLSNLPVPNDAVGFYNPSTGSLRRAMRFSRIATLVQMFVFVCIVLQNLTRDPRAAFLLPILLIAAVVGAIASVHVMLQGGEVDARGRLMALGMFGLLVSSLSVIFLAGVFLIPRLLSVP